jgi:HAD superfamily hydrolase (TIGR01509 family)
MKKTFGIIFDWDGVIIDSSAYHEESWERLSREIKKPLTPDHFIKGYGMKNEYIIPELLGWAKEYSEIRKLSLRKEAIYRQVVNEKGLSALPGVKEWLECVSKNNVPCALGSSTQRDNIRQGLAILGFENYFQGIVTGDDVTKGKPDPQIFLLAAETIHLPPQRCVVFEDTPVGIDAALGGGMKVIAVAGTHPLDALSKACRIVHRMDELSIEDIERLF